MMEEELRKLTSEELLYRFSKYKMFLGYGINETSQVYWDVDSECELIYSILLERLSEAEGK